MAGGSTRTGGCSSPPRCWRRTSGCVFPALDGCALLPCTCARLPQGRRALDPGANARAATAARNFAGVERAPPRRLAPAAHLGGIQRQQDVLLVIGIGVALLEARGARPPGARNACQQRPAGTGEASCAPATRGAAQRPGNHTAMRGRSWGGGSCDLTIRLLRTGAACARDQVGLSRRNTKASYGARRGAGVPLVLRAWRCAGRRVRSGAPLTSPPMGRSVCGACQRPARCNVAALRQPPRPAARPFVHERCLHRPRAAVQKGRRRQRRRDVCQSAAARPVHFGNLQGRWLPGCAGARRRLTLSYTRCKRRRGDQRRCGNTARLQHCCTTHTHTPAVVAAFLGGGDGGGALVRSWGGPAAPAGARRARAMRVAALAAGRRAARWCFCGLAAPPAAPSPTPFHCRRRQQPTGQPPGTPEPVPRP